MKKSLFICIGMLASLLLATNAHAKKPATKENTIGHTTHSAFAGLQNNASLSFTENKGQIKDQYGNDRNDIDYKLDANAITMFIGDAQIHYQWIRNPHPASPQGGSDISGHNNIPSPLGGGQEGASFYRMDVTLLGANKNAQVIAEGMQQYKEMYYLPYHEEALVAHTYTKLTYKNVYPNIDWVIYVASNTSANNNTSPLGAGGLKYDFIVHPGGDPSQIKLQYNGATSLQLKDGALVAETPYGTITENAPYSYYSDSKEQVTSSFKLTNNILSYNISSPWGRPGGASLIIDPQLLWGTYYGGSTYTLGRDIKTDKAGNVYVSGYTNCTSDIATTGAFQVAHSGGSPMNMDGFFTKFTPEGKRVWATYYGGSSPDELSSLVLYDTVVYLTGTATSSGLATSGSHKDTLGGTNDAILVKFDTAGRRQWATYYGGNDLDNGGPIACDASGNVYIGGRTASSNGIATATAHQATVGSGFLAKFNTSGVCQWGTYYGAGTTDTWALQCDNNGNVYMLSFTLDTGFATAGSYQTGLASAGSSSYQACILGKFNSSGVRQWATYYAGTGGSVFDLCLTTDAWDNVYVGGRTYAAIGISTLNSYQPAIAGFNDNFIVKFTGNGTRVWGTYYGGTGEDVATSLEFSAATANIYLSCMSNSAGLATPGAYQTSNNGFNDGIIAVFDTAGMMKHTTYYGGSSNDAITGITCNAGRAYITGATNSSNGIATTGAFLTTSPGTNPSFLAAWVTDTAVFIKQPYTDTLFCAGDSLILRDTVFYGFRNGNTFTVQLSDAAGSFASPVNIGSSSGRLSGSIRCRIPLNTATGLAYRIRIAASAPAYNSPDNYFNIHIKAVPQGFSGSSNSPICEPDTIQLNASTTSSGVTWAWTGPLSFSSTTQNNKRYAPYTTYGGKYVIAATLTTTGCKLTDTIPVMVKARPGAVEATSNSPVCFGDTLQLNARCLGCVAVPTYSWSGPGSFTSTAQDTTRTPATPADSGNYMLKVTLNGCVDSTTTTVDVHHLIAKPVAGNNGTVCTGSTLILTADTIANASYQWSGPSFTAAVQNPELPNTQNSNAGNYIVTIIVDGCESEPDTTNVVVSQGPLLLVTIKPDSICAADSINLHLSVTNSGKHPKYQWLKNGNPLSGATDSVYTVHTVNNGDKFTMLLTPDTGAACFTPVLSDTATIKVLPYQPPYVTMSVSDSNAWPGLYITFTALDSNAGNNPTYEWRVNGFPVGNGKSWGSTTLLDGDIVCVIITSSNYCADPLADTSCYVVKIATGIHDASNSKLRIYPNPASTQVTIEGLSTGTTIQLNDVYGRTVYHGTATQSTTTINTQNLVPGNYILQLTDSNGIRRSYKLVKE